MKIKIKDNFPIDSAYDPASEAEIAMRGKVVETIESPVTWETHLTWFEYEDGERMCLYPEEFEVVEP